MNNKCNYKIVFFILIVTLSTLSASAQRVVWSASKGNTSDIITDKSVKRQSFPKEFKLFDLNVEPLKNQLSSIADSKSDSTIISLPNADGTIEQFEVFEASNFEPELQAKFPDIRAFSGRGITDKYATVKLSISPQGVSGMVFRAASNLIKIDGESEFIEPYSADHGTYAVYRSDREKGQLPWACATEEKSLFSDWMENMPAPQVVLSNERTIRTMRLAQSCNGEYANYFGATSSANVSKVLAAFNATLTRANGVYERDLGVHLNLIPQTTNIIFYVPATDPYSTSISDWNEQLRGAIIAAGITTDMYDIGHMFGSTGGGGNAGCIGCVCSTGAGVAGHEKGMGITSPADGIPMGDNFDIDYVTHEMGHQMGANHTFSIGSLPVPEMLGQDKEVGSGITIMGYAGITQADVAPHSLDVFHETSIGQIQANLPTRGCPVAGIIPITANRPPVVAPVINRRIPIMTPFRLTGSATDPDGDAVTYNWEQDDSSENLGATIAYATAFAAKPIGPNWLTFPSSTSGTKLFPRLSTILAGQFTTAALPGADDPTTFIEALSSITRDLKFRLTVRDNHPYVPNVAIGQTQFTDTTVSVTNLAGPFLIVQPNMNESYASGSTQTVIWTVANTDLILGTTNVNIKLSTDGGQTFPITLKANTPNDGTESVAMPNISTTTARIMVEAVGNIFFDISNTNFTLTGAAPQGLESDVQPRSTGDGVVDADDIQQIRRFSVGLDMPYQSNEFQRADPSPRSTSGDGFLDADDVQQARRYSVGTDAGQPAAGPAAASGFNAVESYSSKLLLEQIIGIESPKADDTVKAAKIRALRVDGSKAIVSGQTITVPVPVRVEAKGDEAGYTFSLNYDSAVLSNPVVSIGSAGGDVVSNVSRAGEIGFSITSFSGGTIAAGANQTLVYVQFTLAAGAKGRMTPIGFSSSLARQKATGVDPSSPIDQPIYTDGIVNLGGAIKSQPFTTGRSGK